VPFVKLQMRKFIVAFAICALGASSLVAARDRWADETEHVSRTIPLEPGGTLRLKSFSGRVTITASDDAEVVVDAVRRAPRERLSRITLDIHSEGSKVVVIDADHRERSWFMFTGNNVVETDFDIKVPRRTNLDVSVFSAAVSADGVEGSHRLNGFSSRVSLTDVSGPIRAHSFSGSILIRTKTWPADELIDVNTFSGNIELHLPESAHGRVTFNSFSGRLNSEMPLTLHSTSRRSLTADLGGGGDATLSFKTFSGSVRIDR
jgi:hypothetical protein